jgi:hypothetical protein
MTTPPKARRTDVSDTDRDVERYELLRREALHGGASGFRLGLALLERRGVTAWIRTCPSPSASARTPSCRPSPSAVELPAAAEELVQALASLALARVAG